ncbi:MAG: intradiol ring-cleavage dioxygenase [Thermomicrobiales bacterium]
MTNGRPTGRPILEGRTMENDDLPVGRILGRREVLALFGVSGAALLAGCVPGQSGAPQPTSTAPQATTGGATAAPRSLSLPASSPATATSICVATPAETEGPYFVDEQLNRSDIRTDPSDGTIKAGVPLQLAFTISTISGGACLPLAGATVDIWHCDALGVYSDVQNSVGKKFLRGLQTTDASGTAKFTTIYPGWYMGRAVHIHFKVRTNPTASKGTEFTSQLFFDETLTDQIHAQAPYASKGKRDILNSRDMVYATGGDQLLLTLTKAGDGYATLFNVGLNGA